jgi:hypothetical protein
VSIYLFPTTSLIPYSPKRIPSWTDRILFATASDDPSDLSTSSIIPLVYTPVPSYTTSDHKPVIALLQLPPPHAGSATIPLLPQPYQFSHDSYWTWKRYTGKVLGWVIGWIWSIFWLTGAGNAIVGICGYLLGMIGIAWWNSLNA